MIAAILFDDVVTGDGPALQRTATDSGEPPTIAAAPLFVGEGSPGIGATFGRYVVIEHVATGGMGHLLRAYDPKLQREVAIKLLRRQQDPEARFALEREARAMARLSHPNVVPIYDVDVHGDPAFLAMEYVVGRSLGAWVTETKPSWREIVAAYVQAGHGLVAAHEVGVIHRDFKPANVVVGADGRVRVVDFGIATARDATERDEVDSVRAADAASADSSVIGTPPYMAPEQHTGGTLDARTDQYGFCVALFEQLWGVRPFEGRDLDALVRAKTAGPPPRPSAPRLPRALYDAIARGLAPDADRRWPTMQALLGELARVRTASRRRGAVVLGTLAAAAVIVPVASTRDDACATAGDPVAEAWNPAVAEQLGAAFTATPTALAPEAWARVAPVVDAWAGQWARARVDACEATRTRGEQSDALMDARIQCLDTQLAELEGLLSVWRTPDVEVVRAAVDSVSTLPSVARCAEAEHVLARLPPPPEAIAARVLAVRGSLATIDALRRAARLGELDALVEAARQEAASLGYGPLEAEAHRVFADVCAARGDHACAEAGLVDAYFAALRVGHDEVAAEAASGLIFTIAWHRGDAQAALEWVEHARAATERAADPIATANFHDRLGTLHETRDGHLDEALAEYELAARLFEAAAGPDDPRLGGVANNIGMVLAELGRTDEAEAAYERALALWSRSLGASHPTVGTALQNLASVHLRRGDAAKAEELLARAVAIDEAALGPEHPELVVKLANLGSARADLGRFEDAERTYRRGLALAERHLGPDDDQVGLHLNNLGTVYQSLGRNAEATAAFRRALDIVERSRGPEHPDVGHALVNLGLDALNRDAPAEARPWLARAVALWQGRAEPDLSKAEYLLGDALARLGDHTGAAVHFGRCIASWHDTAQTRPILAGALLAWALQLVHVGRHDEAAAVLVASFALPRAEGVVGEARAEAALALALRRRVRGRPTVRRWLEDSRRAYERSGQSEAAQIIARALDELDGNAAR